MEDRELILAKHIGFLKKCALFYSLLGWVCLGWVFLLFGLVFLRPDITHFIAENRLAPTQFDWSDMLAVFSLFVGSRVIRVIVHVFEEMKLVV
ncbi:MAG: hypothetical protein AB7F75_12505 [Planctomycetota bacterium]